jgi:hypothetical protein
MLPFEVREIAEEVPGSRPDAMQIDVVKPIAQLLDAPRQDFRRAWGQGRARVAISISMQMG